MPYDKNGKYYRQPVYNRNFISGKVNEKKLTYEEEADNEEFEEADNDAFNARLLRICLLALTGFIGIPFILIFINGLITGTINLQPNSNRQNPKNDTPSIEETLDNMLQYQKEKDSRRRQEKIIDKFIDKEMNSW